MSVKPLVQSRESSCSPSSIALHLPSSLLLPFTHLLMIRPKGESGGTSTPNRTKNPSICRWWKCRSDFKAPLDKLLQTDFSSSEKCLKYLTPLLWLILLELPMVLFVTCCLSVTHHHIWSFRTSTLIEICLQDIVEKISQTFATCLYKQQYSYSLEKKQTKKPIWSVLWATIILVSWEKSYCLF